MRRRSLPLAASLAVVIPLSGCGSDSSGQAGDGASAAPGGKTPVWVGVGTGAYKVALTADAFGAEGLQVVEKPVNSGAAAIPLLLNGQIQFTAADTVGALTAISKGVPLVIVAMAASSGTSTSDDVTAVMVKKDGPIKSAGDLAGRKVAVNGIGNTSQLSAVAAIDKLGGDSTKVKFVEIPPNAMTAAVENGTVDAEVTSEPGVSQGQAAGLTTLFSPMAEALPSSPLFVYVTSKDYLAKNRDVVERFARSMVKANEFMDGSPDTVREGASTILKLTPDQAAKMILPRFTPSSVGKPALQTVVDLMIKYKTINAPVDLDQAFLTP